MILWFLFRAIGPIFPILASLASGTPIDQNQEGTPSASPAAHFVVAQQSLDPVKWTEVTQTWVGIATLGVTIIGFAVLVHQIRHAKNTLHGSTHAAIYSQQHAINEFFIQHPDLWRYFYDDCDCREDDENRPRLIPATYMIADFFEHLSQQRPNLPSGIWPAWKRYMQHVYKKSPILREHCLRNRLWYDSEFIGMISAEH